MSIPRVSTKKGTEQPGTVRMGRTPKGAESPGPQTGARRIVGIDVGLSRVSVAYFDLSPEQATRWYASDLNRKVAAFKSCWHVTTPPDMPLPERVAQIGRALTAEFRVTGPDHYFIEEPQAAGTYARNQANAEKYGSFGGDFQRNISFVYIALGIIAAVCHEQASRINGTCQLVKPARFGLKSGKKADRLEFVRLCLSRLRSPVVLTNPNDVDAVGVALGAEWPL